ncbi:MAG: hypothetical protein U0V87_12910 [Acidobacteriota bacterium]
MIGTALAGDPQRYALEAGDGVPGAFRVLIIPGSTGTWACEATWTGRALAGLWVEDGNGKTVRRLVGSSPLLLELPVDGQTLPIDQKLIVRFAPFTARGPMTGWLTVTAPAQESEANIQTPPAPVSLIEPPVRGWGACLVPAFGDDTAGRSLRALAEALEPPTPKLKAWMSRWAGRIAASVHEEDDGRVSRRGFDLLWEDLAADPPVDDASGRAFRGVLAAIEDLVRREERPRERKSAAERRVQIVEALGCLK